MYQLGTYKHLTNTYHDQFQRRHESMTSLGNIPLLLHSAEFVHLHGVGIFERAYTQSGINLLH